MAIIILQVGPAGRDSTPALYAIEDVVNAEGVVDTRSLVRLILDRDDHLVRDTLVTRDQRFFGHFGGHRLAEGRFLVTAHGGVIDIPARKVIHDEQDGTVLGLDGAKVIFRIDNSRRPWGVFAFDLHHLEVTPVAAGGRWDLPGLRSPDGTMSVESDGWQFGWIRLHRLGQEPLILVKQTHYQCSPLSSWGPIGVPRLWLDDGHILAGVANKRLVIFTTLGVEETTIDLKDAPTDLLSPASLRRDPVGNIIYHCGRQDFQIDLPNRSVTPPQSQVLGYGFEVSEAVDQEGRRTVSRNGKSIGQWVFNPSQAVVAPGLVAFPYIKPEDGFNLGYPEGVAVWDARVGDWRTTKLWASELVGWSQ